MAKEEVKLEELRKEMDELLSGDVIPEPKVKETVPNELLDEFAEKMRGYAERTGKYELYYPLVSKKNDKDEVTTQGLLMTLGLPETRKVKDPKPGEDTELPVTSLKSSFRDYLVENHSIIVSKPRNVEGNLMMFTVAEVLDSGDDVPEVGIDKEEEIDADLEEVGAITEETKE